jgi:hypothetical protein
MKKKLGLFALLVCVIIAGLFCAQRYFGPNLTIREVIGSWRGVVTDTPPQQKPLPPNYKKKTNQ